MANQIHVDAVEGHINLPCEMDTTGTIHVSEL